MGLSMTANNTSRKKGFPPSIDNNTKVLIFGTFPGEESLRKKQYYGNTNNKFWKLLGEVVNEDLVNMEYELRLKTILKHNIGMWDIIESCDRTGSSDNKIVNETLNDFSNLNKFESLNVLCFNGKNQEKYLKKHKLVLSERFKIITLSSSSPANARMTFDEKLKNWKTIIEFI